MSVSRSHLRARFGTPAAGAVVALAALLGFGGCFVSFDGYELAGQSGGMGGQVAQGGRAGAQASAGAAQAGAATGGTPGDAGSGAGGASAGASGGTPNGGAGNAGGASAGSGGVPNVAGGGAGGAPAGGAPAGGASGLHCPEPNGRISVEVPLPAGGFYCVDRAEVRNVDYKAFVDAQATNPVAQSAACGFNTSYAPDTASGCQYDPVAKKNVPVACVDWCDAAAYCKWEGKHLCGKLAGGTNATADYANASQSAWYRACSLAGAQAFPYGNTYQGGTCVGLDNPNNVNPTAVPNTLCEGGYSGLYDMSGNVAEWEDSCSANSGAADTCLFRGGGYLSIDKWVGTTSSLRCDSSQKLPTKARSSRDKEIGFRCCSEPVSGP